MLRRAVHTPFTGRVARLPPALFERFFHTVVGPAAALSYVATSAAGQGSGPADAALCQRTTSLLQQLFGRLRAAGQAEAERGGRGVVFASDRPSGGHGRVAGGRAGREPLQVPCGQPEHQRACRVALPRAAWKWVHRSPTCPPHPPTCPTRPAVEAIQRSDVNACCLPGGIVFVHSGLIRAVQGRPDSLAFVLGHEVGHAVGRHRCGPPAGPTCLLPIRGARCCSCCRHIVAVRLSSGLHACAVPMPPSHDSPQPGEGCLHIPGPVRPGRRRGPGGAPAQGAPPGRQTSSARPSRLLASAGPLHEFWRPASVCPQGCSAELMPPAACARPQAALPDASDEWVAARLKTLDGLLQARSCCFWAALGREYASRERRQAGHALARCLHLFRHTPALPQALPVRRPTAHSYRAGSTCCSWARAGAMSTRPTSWRWRWGAPRAWTGGLRVGRGSGWHRRLAAASGRRRWLPRASLN